MWQRIKSSWLLISCIALLLLLLLTAALEYRWINRVSDADRRQRHEFIETSLRGFSDDFRETISRPVPFFRASLAASKEKSFESSLIDLTKQWRSSSDRPQLLKSVSIGAQTDNGFVFERLLAGNDQLKNESWPEEFTRYRTILEKRLRMPGGEPPLFPNGFALELSRDDPVLVFPLVTGAPPPPENQATNRGASGSNAESSGQSRDNGPPSPQAQLPRDPLSSLRPAPPQGGIHVPELKDWCFLEINTEYLQQFLVPELIARHYDQIARSDYEIAIVSLRPFQIIYQSDPSSKPESLAQVDAGVVLFEKGTQLGRPGPPPPRADGPPPDDRPPRPPPPGGPPPREGPRILVAGTQRISLADIAANRPGQSDDDAWLLVLKSKSGSLDSLAEESRHHNLILSFGILLVLAASMTMLVLATSRARSLAQQQMEFVAGVSHELRTPLTVIQSTSYNLSKGMIQDAVRVQQYGAVIQKEARRLIDQVERMLSFAGIQSGRKLYDLRPTRVGEIIDRALAEYDDALTENNWRVEKEIDRDLPLVLADAGALESSVKNLLENAVKYAAICKWLSVSARRAQDGSGEVLITIADRGPGIPPKDLPHIFEPFYRGRRTDSSSQNGAGLGLCIVDRQMRAQGGHVTVESSSAGTSFTLHLPALATEAQKSGENKNVVVK
jgi:signal transduction histidine kinase